MALELWDSFFCLEQNNIDTYNIDLAYAINILAKKPEYKYSILYYLNKFNNENKKLPKIVSLFLSIKVTEFYSFKKIWMDLISSSPEITKEESKSWWSDWKKNIQNKITSLGIKMFLPEEIRAKIHKLVGMTEEEVTKIDRISLDFFKKNKLNNFELLSLFLEVIDCIVFKGNTISNLKIILNYDKVIEDYIKNSPIESAFLKEVIINKETNMNTFYESLSIDINRNHQRSQSGGGIKKLISKLKNKFKKIPKNTNDTSEEDVLKLVEENKTNSDTEEDYKPDDEKKTNSDTEEDYIPDDDDDTIFKLIEGERLTPSLLLLLSLRIKPTSELRIIGEGLIPIIKEGEQPEKNWIDYLKAFKKSFVNFRELYEGNLQNDNKQKLSKFRSRFFKPFKAMISAGVQSVLSKIIFKVLDIDEILKHVTNGDWVLTWEHFDSTIRKINHLSKLPVKKQIAVYLAYYIYLLPIEVTYFKKILKDKDYKFYMELKKKFIEKDKNCIKETGRLLISDDQFNKIYSEPEKEISKLEKSDLCTPQKKN